MSSFQRELRCKRDTSHKMRSNRRPDRKGMEANKSTIFATMIEI